MMAPVPIPRMKILIVTATVYLIPIVTASVVVALNTMHAVFAMAQVAIEVRRKKPREIFSPLKTMVMAPGT